MQLPRAGVFYRRDGALRLSAAGHCAAGNAVYASGHIAGTGRRHLCQRQHAAAGRCAAPVPAAAGHTRRTRRIQPRRAVNLHTADNAAVRIGNAFPASFRGRGPCDAAKPGRVQPRLLPAAARIGKFD